jgi:hypothetical protein
MEQIFEIEYIDNHGSLVKKIITEKNKGSHFEISRKLAYIAECFFDDNSIELGKTPFTIRYFPANHKD